MNEKLHSIRWRIALPYIVLILLIMAGLTLYLSDFVRDLYVDNLETNLTAQARLLADTLQTPLAHGEPAETFDLLARHHADLLDARVTIIGADGVVLGESHEDRSTMDNHLRRPEVQQALAQGEGSSIRLSRTVGYNMMYVAAPIRSDGQMLGFARVSLPLRDIEGGVAHLRRAILAATALAAVLSVILAILIAGRTTRPVRQLTRVANQLAAGNLNARLFPTTRDEVGQLTDAFNQMADQLQEKVVRLSSEQSRLAAVLNHMADGVLITDAGGEIQLVNPAAARILGTTEAQALGRSFAQVTRHHHIIGVWERCRVAGEEQVEVVEADGRSIFLRVIATPLPEADPEGFLVILQDLTEVRRLEAMRRDFIANISHELRTPLASLKALVDTLQDAALDDPPAARRFLDRADAEVDALTQMVQELLELSRIESGQAPLKLESVDVVAIVVPPTERLQPQAERAGLHTQFDLPPNLPPVLADVEQVRQVVTNLVHNAIKFTPSGGSVTISAQTAGEHVVISVRDTGRGIPAEDLPRIFERFYKADRARSSGGTGLGLAIVKHIVQAHGGRIWAESVEGRGSTFFFTLPAAGQRVKNSP